LVRGSVAVRESMSQPRLGAVFHVFLHFSVRDFGKARGEFELDDDVGAEGEEGRMAGRRKGVHSGLVGPRDAWPTTSTVWQEEAAWGFRYGTAPVVSRPSL
jgi:hypothetical protein